MAAIFDENVWPPTVYRYFASQVTILEIVSTLAKYQHKVINDLNRLNNG
jgi:hypothetical protein